MKAENNLNKKKKVSFEESVIDITMNEIEDKFNLSVGIIVGYSVLTLTILTLLIGIRGQLNINNHILYSIINPIINFITNPYTIFFICLGEFLYAGFAACKAIRGKIEKRNLMYRKLLLNPDLYTKEDIKIIDGIIKKKKLRNFYD